MAIKASVIQFMAVLLTIFVSALPLLTEAQERCGAVFFDSTRAERNLFKARKNLNNESIDLMADLKTSLHKMDKATVESRVKDFQTRIEDYFKLAGVSFKVEPAAISLKDLSDTAQVTIFYKIYELSGSRFGDESSRIIEGAQAHKTFARVPLIVKFDPLYVIRYDSGAHYNSDPNEIVIGPHVIGRDFAGTRALLRHELQHAFERMKIEHGQMTLARISLFNPGLERNNFYDMLLLEDELEGHMREIRAVAHPDRVKKDERFFSLMNSEERKAALLSARVQDFNTLVSSTEKLAARIKQANSLLELYLYDPSQVPLFQLTLPDPKVEPQLLKTSRGLMVIIKMPPPYSVARIYLNGVIKSDRPSVEEIQAAVFKILTWNNQRIEQLERELSLIKLNNVQGKSL